MTSFTEPPPPIADVDAYVRTRESWHALAEQVLSSARYRSDRKIGLRATRGGFGTPRFGADEQVRIDGTTLVRTVGQDETREELTTLRAAAAAVGIEPGAPDVYTATTTVDPDRPLELDPAGARVLAWVYDVGAAVLAELRADPESNPAGADPPAIVQIWPEHFDLATDLGAPSARANYGVSPGDVAHPEPYLYVGPWAMDAARADPFWNESFGASLSYAALAAAPRAFDAALAFFRRGRALVGNAG